mmetsp:Transcript_56261/g.148466  ORF Transcript_56261/g.148466 Transcript_56261/m.148466 type:complete len:321 (-) Transcript_56261:1032-1994(-)
MASPPACSDSYRTISRWNSCLGSSTRAAPIRRHHGRRNSAEGVSAESRVMAVCTARVALFMASLSGANSHPRPPPSLGVATPSTSAQVPGVGSCPVCWRARLSATARHRPLNRFAPSGESSASGRSAAPATPPTRKARPRPTAASATTESEAVSIGPSTRTSARCGLHAAGPFHTAGDSARSSRSTGRPDSTSSSVRARPAAPGSTRPEDTSATPNKPARRSNESRMRPDPSSRGPVAKLTRASCSKRVAVEPASRPSICFRSASAEASSSTRPDPAQISGDVPRARVNDNPVSPYSTTCSISMYPPLFPSTSRPRASRG